MLWSRSASLIEDDADVRGHRDDHLAVVLGLALVAALEGDAGELGHAVDERRDLLAELGAHLVERRAGVLHRVVQQRRAQRLGVEPHAGADLGHADRVDDEVLAGAPALVRVVLAGEHERALHAFARRICLGGVGGVLLDHREQVAEQATLEVGEGIRRARRGVRRGAVHGLVVELELRRCGAPGALVRHRGSGPLARAGGARLGSARRRPVLGRGGLGRLALRARAGGRRFR